MDQLTLGKLIEILSSMPKDLRVNYGFCNMKPTKISSSRGYYAQPALGWSADRYREDEEVTVQRLLGELQKGLTDTFHGWKGGEYQYTKDSLLWVDNPGKWSSTCITGVTRLDHLVILQLGTMA